MPPRKRPGRKAMSIELAKKIFEVEASQDRVWRLIGKVIFSSLPGMENLEILDENNFRSILRMKVFGIPVSLKLKGEMTDMSPPGSFSVNLFLEAPGGLFKTDQKVAFALTPVKNGKTSVTCKATVEDLGFLPRLLLVGQARRFASGTFAAIEKRLQELA
jgi:carbon monoxide dehydrogenase subunit G